MRKTVLTGLGLATVWNQVRYARESNPSKAARNIEKLMKLSKNVAMAVC